MRTLYANFATVLLSSGCADARVPPNIIMGEDAGNLFVTRNVANMVVNTDTNLMSALQYGVNYLQVSHVIVCGHYECGGIRAAATNNDFIAPLELWLRNIRDVYATHRAELDAIEDAEVRHRRLVELNVIQQVVNVMKTGSVQSRRKVTHNNLGEAHMTPLVHAMVFDPKSGELKRLDVDFAQYEDELDSVYGLHTI
jgi:carbonic anhydrase